MDIRTIRHMVPQVQKTMFLGKEIEILGEKVLAAAFCLTEYTLKLYLFAEGNDRMEDTEKFKKIERKRKRGTLTKREERLAQFEKSKEGIFDLLEEIRVQGNVYGIASITGGRLGEFDGEGMMLFYYFLLNHVSFGGLEKSDLSNVENWILEFEGEYQQFPFSMEDLDTLEVVIKPRNFPVLVKRKMKVAVGKQKARKQKFFCEETGKDIEFFINVIELADIRTELLERYENMFQEGMVTQKEEFFIYLDSLCPEGKRLVLVEYECENACLEFYTKEQLLERVKPIQGATSFFLVGKLKKSIGVHGMRLKASVIPYPVEADTEQIELELLCAFVQEKENNSRTVVHW